jgi:hypothetical protein
MPELAGYESEIIHGIYRGDLAANTPPTYHRTPSTLPEPESP